MFSSWWDFKEVCASCDKSACSFVLCLKLAKNLVCILCLMINFNIVITKLWGACCTQSCYPSCGLNIIWGMFNTVVFKLRGVYCTQSCDPPCSLEIIWGHKMSKFLNLITYLLACLPRNQVVNTLVWFMMSHWHAEVWIWIRKISVVLPLP
jgi:hypothetical protein